MRPPVDRRAQMQPPVSRVTVIATEREVDDPERLANVLAILDRLLDMPTTPDEVPGP